MQAAIDSHRSSAAAPNLRGVLLVRAYHRLAHRPRGRGGVWAAVAQSATKGGLKNLTFRAAKTQHAGQPLFPHLSLLALLFPPYYYYYPIAERHPKSRLPTSASTELSRNIHRRLFQPQHRHHPRSSPSCSTLRTSLSKQCVLSLPPLSRRGLQPLTQSLPAATAITRTPPPRYPLTTSQDGSQAH